MMKRNLITVILTLTLMTAITSPVLAYNYEYPGAEPGLFAKPTSVDEVRVVGDYTNESDNINRSKDSSFIPPSFGASESNMPATGTLLTPGISVVTTNPGISTANDGSVYHPADNGGLVLPPALVESSAAGSTNKFTLPDGLLYPDGSLGTLSIPKLSLSAKVYEDESLENLAKGIGHFKSTSCWDGNVGFAAHNRGLADFFGEIHTLKSGDRITYSTKLGARTYEVYYVGQVSETDTSRLGRTSENILTLITCVRNVRDQRVCVQAREVS